MLYKSLKWGVASCVCSEVHVQQRRKVVYVQHIGDQVTFGILLSFGIVLAVGSVHDYFKESMCRIKYFESK